MAILVLYRMNKRGNKTLFFFNKKRLEYEYTYLMGSLNRLLTVCNKNF